MSNNEPRAYNYEGPNETGESSRDPTRARADSSDSSDCSKSKDQIPPEGHPSNRSTGEPDNTYGPPAFDHVLLAKLSSRTKTYHLPSEDDPSKPACRHGTVDGRGKTAESWTPVDADSPRLHNKSLCQWCDPDTEVETATMPNETGADVLDDLSVDDVDILTDGGLDISVDELEQRKRQTSTTPTDQRKRCPNCGSLKVHRKSPNAVGQRRFDADFRCGACDEHFDEPDDPLVATDGGTEKCPNCDTDLFVQGSPKKDEDWWCHGCDSHFTRPAITDGGRERRTYAGDVHAVQQMAGVGDQDNTCRNGTRGCPGPNADVAELPCSACLLNGDEDPDDPPLRADGGNPRQLLETDSAVGRRDN